METHMRVWAYNPAHILIVIHMNFTVSGSVQSISVQSDA